MLEAWGRKKGPGSYLYIIKERENKNEENG